MVWNKTRILAELRRLHQAKKDLSYNGLARTHQSLVSAAAYHCGSYRRAVEQAGIDYSQIIRRPHWNRQNIIGLIKAARRKGEDLNWASVTRRRDELGRAAFASLQPRLFGTWHRALHAAGLDADDISKYRHWDRDSIAFELRSRYQNHDHLNSGAIQADDPGLHAAAVRHFGKYDAALKAARLPTEKIRQRRSWEKPDVTKAIKAVKKSGKSVSDSVVRRETPALYGAAVRLFGSFTAARQAAGVKFSRSRRGA